MVRPPDGEKKTVCKGERGSKDERVEKEGVEVRP